MQIYARVVDGIVVELWPHSPDAPMPDPQPTPVEVFGEEVGSQFVACGPEVQQGWLLKGKKFSAPVPTPPAPALDLAAYISGSHKALRDGGLEIGGIRIATDAESRGLIDGAYALSQAQPEAKIDFKAASGWVTVDAQTIQTIALAVGQWVQLCYSAYRKLDEARAGGTVTTTDEVDAAYAAVALPG